MSRRRLSVTLAFGLAATPVAAHVGFAANDLYAGLLHPLLHLATLLPLIAASLWLAQHPPARVAALAATLLSATLLGALVGHFSTITFPLELPLLALGIVLGAAVAIARPTSAVVSILLIGMVGALHGYDNIAPVRNELNDRLLYTSGLLLATGLVPLHAVPWLIGRQALWVRTAIRIIGSWIAAASLLVLALRYLA